MKNEKPIPKRTEKLIYQEANSRCSFCEETDIAALEVHHIKGRADGGDNEPENLILVCGNCHARITGGDIDIHQVFRVKLRLQRGEAGARLRRRTDRPASNVIRFQARANSGIVANNLQIHTTNKRIKVEPPEGTISAERDKLNYVKHLIKRYNEFRKSDPATPNFSYAVIYKTIEKEFKCEWAYVPLGRFSELASYLQRRIDGTRLGRINTSKGIKNYSSFADYQSVMK